MIDLSLSLWSVSMDSVVETSAYSCMSPSAGGSEHGDSGTGVFCLCQRLCHLRQKDQLLLRQLHHDVLAELELHGQVATVPVHPAITPYQQSSHFGCMACRKGAHLFRAHGIVAMERSVDDGNLL